ncbi:hypothetical protein BC828DRAFT_376884 [Blastocladiella britannica]|nr:hypothetical protein BC828DRAFT_376884 [Blastocladiella britannica]
MPGTQCPALTAILDAVHYNGNRSSTDCCDWPGIFCNEDGTVNWLSLSNNQLTGSIPDLTNLTRLTEVGLNNNQLTGRVPESLGKMTKLTGIWLDRNRLNGPIPDSLSQLPNLEWLHLYNNQLNGSIPEGLGKLSNLFSLHLAGNELTGTIPESLSELKSLSVLVLSNNSLTGTIPKGLSKLSKLTELYLINNRLDGPIPNIQANTNCSILPQTGVQPLCFSGNSGLCYDDVKVSISTCPGSIPSVSNVDVPSQTPSSIPLIPVVLGVVATLVVLAAAIAIFMIRRRRPEKPAALDTSALLKSPSSSSKLAVQDAILPAFPVIVEQEDMYLPTHSNLGSYVEVAEDDGREGSLYLPSQVGLHDTFGSTLVGTRGPCSK